MGALKEAHFVNKLRTSALRPHEDCIGRRDAGSLRPCDQRKLHTGGPQTLAPRIAAWLRPHEEDRSYTWSRGGPPLGPLRRNRGAHAIGESSMGSGLARRPDETQLCKYPALWSDPASQWERHGATRRRGPGRDSQKSETHRLARSRSRAFRGPWPVPGPAHEHLRRLRPGRCSATSSPADAPVLPDTSTGLSG